MLQYELEWFPTLIGAVYPFFSIGEKVSGFRYFETTTYDVNGKKYVGRYVIHGSRCNITRGLAMNMVKKKEKELRDY